jgi:hypothetical protein
MQNAMFVLVFDFVLHLTQSWIVHHGIKLLECCENILFSNLFKSYGEYEMCIGL